MQVSRQGINLKCCIFIRRHTIIKIALNPFDHRSPTMKSIEMCRQAPSGWVGGIGCRMGHVKRFVTVSSCGSFVQIGLFPYTSSANSIIV